RRRPAYCDRRCRWPPAPAPPPGRRSRAHARPRAGTRSWWRRRARRRGSWCLDLPSSLTYYYTHARKIRLGVRPWELDQSQASRRCLGVHPMERNSRKLVRMLENDGWVLDRVNGDHHTFKHPDRNEIITVTHPRRGLPTGLVRRIYKLAGWRPGRWCELEIAGTAAWSGTVMPM